MIKKMFLLFLCLSFFPLFAQENNDKKLDITSSDCSSEISDELNSYKELLTELNYQKLKLEKENEEI